MLTFIVLGHFVYLTMGPHDFVAVLEAEDDDLVASTSSPWKRRGT
jgi:uncharacterized protein with GYD domain